MTRECHTHRLQTNPRHRKKNETEHGQPHDSNNIIDV